MNAPAGQWLDISDWKWYNAHPQVSRRLARRLHGENKPGKLGLVQLVAEAYLALLRGMPAEDSVLFAKELIVQRVVRPSMYLKSHSFARYILKPIPIDPSVYLHQIGCCMPHALLHSCRSFAQKVGISIRAF